MPEQMVKLIEGSCAGHHPEVAEIHRAVSVIAAGRAWFGFGDSVRWRPRMSGMTVMARVNDWAL